MDVIEYVAYITVIFCTYFFLFRFCVGCVCVSSLLICLFYSWKLIHSRCTFVNSYMESNWIESVSQYVERIVWDSFIWMFSSRVFFSVLWCFSLSLSLLIFTQSLPQKRINQFQTQMETIHRIKSGAFFSSASRPYINSITILSKWDIFVDYLCIPITQYKQHRQIVVIVVYSYVHSFVDKSLERTKIIEYEFVLWMSSRKPTKKKHFNFHS